MSRLVIHDDAFQLGITHPVVCLIEKASVLPSPQTYDDEIESLMHLLEQPETILERLEVRTFRALFARMGYENHTPAGHRLIESLRKRGFKRYNNVIDAYNIASALSGSGLGMHDASILRQRTTDLHVYCASGNEQITPIFKDDPIRVNKGDLVYGFGSGDMNVLAWLGRKDVDADPYKITDNTKSFLLVALGNQETSEEYNRQPCLKTLELIRRTCPQATCDFIPSSIPNAAIRPAP